MNTVSMINPVMLASQSTQDAMESASRLVDSSLSLDNNYADLSDLLQVPKHSKYMWTSRSVDLQVVNFVILKD